MPTSELQSSRKYGKIQHILLPIVPLIQLVISMVPLTLPALKVLQKISSILPSIPKVLPMPVVPLIAPLVPYQWLIDRWYHWENHEPTHCSLPSNLDCTVQFLCEAETTYTRVLSPKQHGIGYSVGNYFYSHEKCNILHRLVCIMVCNGPISC